jgi:hypothetical protein
MNWVLQRNLDKLQNKLEQIFDGIKKEYHQRLQTNDIIKSNPIHAMNIGKITFKHGHILMMECYILWVKAVDVEYIGKYKDERA